MRSARGPSCASSDPAHRPLQPEHRATSSADPERVDLQLDVLPTSSVRRVESYRRKTPHTTHHQDLPERVTITRSHHPFETKTLEVLATIHRKGQLLLVLILPDGSKSMIPAEWTDFASPAQPRHLVSLQTSEMLGSIEDLLHARAITDALLNRFAASTSEAVEKESHCAGELSESLRSATRRELSLGSDRGRAEVSGHRHVGAADGQRSPAPRRGEER